MQGRQPKAPKESQKRSSMLMKTRWSHRATRDSQGTHTVSNPFFVWKDFFSASSGQLRQFLSIQENFEECSPMACNAVKGP
uniref:Uncharacterized protein n=1 Tax=Ixodes ricinus TaxID=34613 RepID=A0A090XA50_IXORI